MKLLLFKLLFWPRYRYYIWLKKRQVGKNWDSDEKAMRLYCDLVEPITTYQCADIHLKYESWKSVAKRMTGW